MKHYRRKVDGNQKAVMDALKAELGDTGSVTDVSATGGGIPDLLIGVAGRLCLLMEVKNPDGRGARKKGLYTPAQERFRELWKGPPIITAKSPGEAVDLLRAAIERSG